MVKYRIIAVTDEEGTPHGVDVPTQIMESIASFLFDQIDGVVKDVGSGVYGDKPDLAQDDVRILTRICDGLKEMGVTVE